MENFTKIFIISHASVGGIALVAGAIAILAKKGNNLHKKAGRIFYYTMLASALSALVICLLPGHESAFLFAIGVFSSYFIISGYRSLAFRRKPVINIKDRLLAYGILTTGLVMVLYPLILEGQLNIILTVFGIVGIAFGVRDVQLLHKPDVLKKAWLKLHLGKMMGGYNAAVSAFFVVNQILPGVWNWFVPSIVGGVYISYWITKLNLAQRKVKRMASRS
ncbi:MAG: DUF2306 domain-containing protein [Cytophagaceae bacterium]|nr:DUF2306 domain-containing protein [Cytophagaceae bacterium]|tara:strand:- start:3471 stop:4130 length:660 start_codon:yes stop_codon:yes gene_type:complete